MANEPSTQKVKEETKYVPLADVHADFDWNSRHKSFRDEKAEVDEDGKVVESLEGSFLATKKSIETNGQDIAVIVRPSTKGKKPLDLVCGFRRYEALVRANADKINVPRGGNLDQPLIKVEIRNLTEEEAQALNGRENIERQNLNTCDQAFIVKRMQTKGMTDVAIANAVGMSNGHISQLSRIVKSMSPEILERWRNEKIIQAAMSLDKLEKIAKEETPKKQEEKLQEFLGSSGTKGGNKGKWIETAQKQASAIGTLLGQLEFSERISTENLDFKKHVKELCAGGILVIKGKDGKATDNQWEKIAEAAQTAYDDAMNPEEETEEGVEATTGVRPTANNKDVKGGKAA